MRTLFVGDVHACADELASLLDLAQPSRVILLGDVFNKGPKPEQTWEIVREVGALSVLGNHDLHVIGKAEAGQRLAPAPAIDWLRTLPHFIEGEGWLAVHGGIDPHGGVQATSRTQAVNMRRFPMDEPEADFWWRQYEGPPLVLYGHDAVRGLQDHRPHSLGLDTGCVYGGQLTGYLLEADRILSVPALAAYRPV
jgi:hypothetical protein